MRCIYDYIIFVSDKVLSMHEKYKIWFMRLFNKVILMYEFIEETFLK